MRARCGLYPALGRYFRTMKELADAGCMSVRRAQDCLSGKKQFTEQEKQAIWNAMILKKKGMCSAQSFDEEFRKEMTA